MAVVNAISSTLSVEIRREGRVFRKEDYGQSVLLKIQERALHSCQTISFPLGN
ncbi:hypothetical protein [Paenibacillus sp. NAIST15-1]|uniref:hypothetical protein n=1 Tax=Paenibacillus sp. NAIST15-1 TaxID=1605994 RepID=UPI000AE5A26B|nr:hypothetical protein [Paenibacillus sp. NAIST15-1]